MHKRESMSKQEKGYRSFRYDLFPGIVLDYYFCDGSHVFEERPTVHNVTDIFLINHCYRGGFEATMRDGNQNYRGAGETTLSSPSAIAAHSRIPQAVYEGISLCIDIKQIAVWLHQLLAYMNIDLRSIVAHYQLKTRWFSLPPSEQLEALLDQLYQEMPAGDINALRFTALRLIRYVAQENEAQKEQGQYLALKNSHLVHKIAKKLEEQEFFTVPITELVAEEKISYAIFQRIFKEMYKMTPSLYRKKHRLSHAAYLLKMTKMSVIDIASLCGYNNASKFSSAFKKLMGLTPLAYRRQESLTIEE